MTVLNRRQALRGISFGAGGSLLAPIMGRLQAEARGEPLPKRFVFVLEGNGLNPNHVQPVGLARMKEGGKVVAADLAKYELPQALKPIAPFKDRLTVLQGLSGKMCCLGHSNEIGALGAYDAGKGLGEARGETVDYALGRRLSQVFPQIGLGISDKPAHTVIYNSSAAGRGKPLPTQCRPDLAYQALFGAAGGGDARRAMDADKSLLDFLAADVRRTEAGLAGPERDKFRTYLESFEGMRQRHDKLVALEGTLRKHAPPVTDKFKSEVETDRLDAHFDLAAASLVAGLTNVVTIASGVGSQHFSIRFRGLGIDLDKHSIGHGGSLGGRGWEDMALQIRTFHFDLIARLAKKLQAVKEGDGTMLDNTLIVYTSDAAEAHHCRCAEWPFILLGGLGGKLKGGRYLEWPTHGKSGNRHIGNLYTTLLNAVGDKRETFGSPDPLVGTDVDQKGPLSELLT